MNLDNKLQTGDRVKWKVGIFHMVGAVLEDHGESEIEIMSHKRDGVQHNQICFVHSKRLTLIY